MCMRVSELHAPRMLYSKCTQCIPYQNEYAISKVALFSLAGRAVPCALIDALTQLAPVAASS